MHITQPLRRRRQSRRQSGFTLVEIMIVVLIIGVLLNIAAPAFIGARDKGQARACVKNLTNIMTAKEMYVMENRVPASDVTAITWPSIKGYIRTGGGANPTYGPPCPTNGQYYTIGAPSVLPVCPYGTSGANPLAVHQIQ
jgi:prepilin-type N-terminal cleavage/methylation domain-containing protein